MYRVWTLIASYSFLLIAGAASALIWANIDPASYNDLIDLILWEHAPIGHAYEAEGRIVHRLTLKYLVNDVAMALFFAMAAKEVWEALILESGSLRGRRALTPLIATGGGMLAPIVVYLVLAALLGVYVDLRQGWAIPAATDIAFAYLVGRLVFGAGHPAIRFLLLLAIADDAAGLVILALFYPPETLAPAWLLLSLGAAVGAFVLFNWLPRRLDAGDQSRPRSSWVRRRLSFWPYLLAGCLSWYGFFRAGIHPALGLLPVIPAIPHADRAFGLFAEAERFLHDLLNSMEHALKHPVAVVLFLFGLVNAGVEVSAIGVPTWIVLAALLIGKPLGIIAFGWIAARPMGLGLPPGMRMADLVVVGCVAAIGFTVVIFIATVAFPGGELQDAAKMGAVFSLFAAVVAVGAARLLRVVRVTG